LFLDGLVRRAAPVKRAAFSFPKSKEKAQKEDINSKKLIDNR